ncbi:hypothetical protein BC2230_10272 [Burkholderia cepacia]
MHANPAPSVAINSQGLANIGLAGQSLINMRGDLVEDEKYIGRHEMDVALFTHSMRSQKMS